MLQRNTRAGQRRVRAPRTRPVCPRHNNPRRVIFQLIDPPNPPPTHTRRTAEALAVHCEGARHGEAGGACSAETGAVGRLRGRRGGRVASRARFVMPGQSPGRAGTTPSTDAALVTTKKYGTRHAARGAQAHGGLGATLRAGPARGPGCGACVAGAAGVPIAPAASKSEWPRAATQPPSPLPPPHPPIRRPYRPALSLRRCRCSTLATAATRVPWGTRSARLPASRCETCPQRVSGDTGCVLCRA